MGFLYVGWLFAPLARRRAVATRIPSLSLSNSIDNSKKAHGSQNSKVRGRGEVVEGAPGCDGICRNDIIPSSRSKVHWPTILDSDHRYVELNVICDPFLLVDWSDLFWFTAYHCISTPRFVTGYCSQSQWSWYAHACPPPLAQNLSWPTRPDSCRSVKTLYRHSTSNTPKETHESSDPRTVSMTILSTMADHANTEVTSKTCSPPCPSPSRDLCQVSHSTAYLPRNFTTSG